MYRLIIFDLDGTLYDLEDVIASVYQNQVDFLSDYLRKPKSAIQKLFWESRIYPYKSSDSASATELFEKMGVDKQAWKAYKEMHFDVSAINPQNAVSPELILQFSRIATILLLSSNTYQTIIKILNRLNISPAIFSSIVSSDKRYGMGPFNKADEIKGIIQQYGVSGKTVLSIGDRFQTDILPALTVGGDGILLDEPNSIKCVYEDLCENNLQTRTGIYQMFCV